MKQFLIFLLFLIIFTSFDILAQNEEDYDFDPELERQIIDEGGWESEVYSFPEEIYFEDDPQLHEEDSSEEIKRQRMNEELFFEEE